MADGKRRKNKPAVTSGNPKPFLLFICFLASGATSLCLEVAWSKELSYLLGVDLYASTTVVTAFMAGLGLGAVIVSRWYRWERASLLAYAGLQLVIGVCGLASVPLFRATVPMFSFLYETVGFNGSLFMGLRFLMVFGLMMVPVTLMGMTLPVVVGASRGGSGNRFAAWAGLFYGINTVGALTGTLLAGFLLIPRMGILGTCLITGTADILIALCALFLHRRNVGHAREPGGNRPVKGKKRSVKGTYPEAGEGLGQNSVGAVYLLSGAVALALEICWFRLLAQTVGPTVHAFSIMLAVYLGGIGFGSLLGSNRIGRVESPGAAMGWLLTASGIGTLATLFYVNKLPIWYGRMTLALDQSSFTALNLMVQGVTAGLLILPATLPMGMLFPVVTRVYNRAGGATSGAASVGRLYFLNTLGGVIGCLGGGFLLLPRLGTHLCLVAGGGLSLILGAAVLGAAPRGNLPGRARYVTAALALGAVLMVTAPGTDHEVMNMGVYSEMFTGDFKKHLDSEGGERITRGRLLMAREGINNSVAVMADTFGDGNLTLHLSGHWVATTEFYGRIHLHFLGHLPMLFARNTGSAAVIGFGTGITSGCLLQYPELERLDLFEIEPGVIRAAAYFDPVNHRPLADPRTRLITEDGRSQLTYRDTSYDVITADPIHPFMAGAGNLYSEGFYRIARSRMNPGGVFCQWIPMSSVKRASYDTILATLHKVFPHVALFSCFGESIVLASPDPIRIPWETINERFHAGGVYDDFKSLDIRSPYNVFAFFEGGGEGVDAYLDGHGRINTDDNVWVEHHLPFEGFDLSLTTLIHEIREELLPGRERDLLKMVPGLSLARMRLDLSGLSRGTEQNFKRAENARKRKDPEAMERYNRLVFSDIASPRYYPAGLTIARGLKAEGRTDEAVAVLGLLQRKHPAHEEPYEMAAELLFRAGKGAEASVVLRRALMYSPDHPGLNALKRFIDQ